MILPRTHDKILLASTIFVAAGVVIARAFEGHWTSIGIILLAVGGLGMAAGLVLKIKAGR